MAELNPSMDVAIRRATSEDAGPLAVLAERTFRDTFGEDNDPSEMDAHCRQTYSATQQRRETDDPAIDTFLAVTSSGALAGYAMVRAGNAPPVVQGPSPVEIWRIYVDRPYHGLGVAPQLMSACIDAARARNGRTLWLGVWEHNPRAQAFYRKMGFVDVGAHVFVLGDDSQTDRVMVREL